MVNGLFGDGKSFPNNTVSPLHAVVEEDFVFVVGIDGVPGTTGAHTEIERNTN